MAIGNEWGLVIVEKNELFYYLIMSCMMSYYPLVHPIDHILIRLNHSKINPI